METELAHPNPDLPISSAEVQRSRIGWRTAAAMLLALGLLELLSLLQSPASAVLQILGKAAIDGVIAFGLFKQQRWARMLVFFRAAGGAILTTIGIVKTQTYATIPFAVVVLLCPVFMLIGQPGKARTVVTSVVFGLVVVMTALLTILS